MTAYPDVNFRYYFMNQNSLDGLKMLNFEPELTWPLQEDGRATAEATVNSGLGASGLGKGFEAVKNWVENKDELQSKYKHFKDYFNAYLNLTI